MNKKVQAPTLPYSLLIQKLSGGVKADNSIPYYLPDSSEDTTLIFESRFESGNIGKVMQM